MFDKEFSHYLSYGSTDQQTLRELSDHFDGLLVPATIAAFQRAGTGGFVLTLSATANNTPYVIDPRFPLFQQSLPASKKSHQSLSTILSKRELISKDVEPVPEDFDSARIEEISENWATFNLGYSTENNSKFSKYAKRLKEEVQLENASNPKLIFPPYFACSSPHSAWWNKSKELFEATKSAVQAKTNAKTCIRVVAAEDPIALLHLLTDINDQEVAIWVSGLNEMTCNSETLSKYLDTIYQHSQNNRKLFSLYGGFFSVIASSFGLIGSSHGIGFGEFRNWRELAQSGPPPARFYLKQAHRYVKQDQASLLYRADKNLALCDCKVCIGGDPISLDYHDLMKHSVYSRAQEISEYASLTPEAILERLKLELPKFEKDLLASNVPSRFWPSTKHLENWVDALSSSIIKKN